MNEQGTSERAPTAAEVIRRAITAALVDVRKCIPAVVTAYDASKQKASCKPLIKDAYLDEEDARQVESLPVITGIPVVFASAGGFRFTCPISDGNLVIEGQTIKATIGVIFLADRSLDRWLSGSGQEVDPEIDHEHSLTDAIFVPGLSPFGAPLNNVPVSMASVGSDSDGNGRIDFMRGEVHLGTGATKEVARKGDNVNLGDCHVVVVSGVVTAVFINGVQLPVAADPPPPVGQPDRGTISSGSGHIKAVD